MRAAVTRGGEIVVDEVDEPVPGRGQVLVRTLACGICGSDLHALDHLEAFAEFSRGTVGDVDIDPGQDIVFGHEVCGEILDHGPETAREHAPGTRVCALPMVFGPRGPELLGYSNRYPGGFGEYMVLQEMFLEPVPEVLAPEQATLVEPLAVGEHAVARAAPRSGDVCVVIGCGPIGLAVVAALKARGCGPVLATDFSPLRRRLAETLGADVVVDPAADSPFSKWEELGVPRLAIERIAAETLGTPARDAIVFEAVGVPGILQSIIAGAPAGCRIVVVGVCMEPDRIEPAVAINKELDLRFSYGYRPGDFTTCLNRLGDGTIDPAPLITGQVSLDEVADAFALLRRPDQHAKVIVSHARGT